MKFSANSLKKLIKGACYYEIERGYLTSFKYSKAQIDLMCAEGYDNFWRERGVFSAGIRIELKTAHACQGHVDVYALVPKADVFFCDKIHPNEFGCLLLSENLHKIIILIRKFCYKRGMSPAHSLFDAFFFFNIFVGA